MDGINGLCGVVRGLQCLIPFCSVTLCILLVSDVAGCSPTGRTKHVHKTRGKPEDRTSVKVASEA